MKTGSPRYTALMVLWLRGDKDMTYLRSESQVINDVFRADREGKKSVEVRMYESKVQQMLSVLRRMLVGHNVLCAPAVDGKVSMKVRWVAVAR